MFKIIRVYEKEQRALKASIKHWQRMIRQGKKFRKLVKEQKPVYVVSSDALKDTIGESWYAENCALCQMFNNTCSLCPLDAEGVGCVSENNTTWQSVDDSSTWSEWVKNATEMIRLLIRIKRKCRLIWK